MSTLPSAPSFAQIESYQEFQNELNSIRSELETLITAVKGHKAGEAIYEIITKLMPLFEQYNLDYVQGNIANGQNAASYALKISNYIEAQYKKYSEGDKSTTGEGPADNAIKAYNALKAEIAAHPKIFGSMGQAVLSQLKSAMGGNITSGSGLDTYWKNSWTINSPSDPGVNTSGPIMQAFSAAQNQAQSEAAYLQAEAKMANENYQKYSASQHDVESNYINVIKAATTAAQSAGN